jgi:hypothetical protein
VRAIGRRLTDGGGRWWPAGRRKRKRPVGEALGFGGRRTAAFETGRGRRAGRRAG